MAGTALEGPLQPGAPPGTGQWQPAPPASPGIPGHGWLEGNGAAACALDPALALPAGWRRSPRCCRQDGDARPGAQHSPRVAGGAGGLAGLLRRAGGRAAGGPGLSGGGTGQNWTEALAGEKFRLRGRFASPCPRCLDYFRVRTGSRFLKSSAAPAAPAVPLRLRRGRSDATGSRPGAVPGARRPPTLRRGGNSGSARPGGSGTGEPPQTPAPALIPRVPDGSGASIPPRPRHRGAEAPGPRRERPCGRGWASPARLHPA